MVVNTKKYKETTIKDKHYSRLFVSNSVMAEKLGDFVKRIRREKRMSVADVNERSNRRISTSYINKIENEPNVNPSYPKIQALASGLGVTEAEIISLVKGKNPNKGEIANERFITLSKMYSHLSESQKEVLEPLLGAFENAIANSWKIGFKSIVENLLKNIASSYQIVFKFSDAKGITKSPSESLNIWHYKLEPFPNIELTRWINSGVQISVSVPTTYTDDFDKEKLEQGLKAGIKELSIIPTLTPAYMSEISNSKNKTETEIEQKLDFKNSTFFLHDNSILESALKIGFRKFFLPTHDFYEKFSGSEEVSENDGSFDVKENFSDNLNIIKNTNIDGRELATSSKKKIPLSRGISKKKNKAG